MEHLLGGFSLVNKQPLLICRCSVAALTREFSSCLKQKLVCMHTCVGVCICVCVYLCACVCACVCSISKKGNYCGMSSECT